MNSMSERRYYFNPRIVGLVFAALVVAAAGLLFGMDIVNGASTEAGIASDFEEPYEVATKVSRCADFIVSHIDEILDKLIQNDVFNEIVNDRRWEIGKCQGTPVVCVSFGEGDAAGEVVDYRVTADILDADGTRVRGVTVVLNTDLEIIDVFDWPIFKTRPTKLVEDEEHDA